MTPEELEEFEEFDRLIDNLQTKVNALRDELANHDDHVPTIFEALARESVGEPT